MLCKSAEILPLNGRGVVQNLCALAEHKPTHARLSLGGSTYHYPPKSIRHLATTCRKNYSLSRSLGWGGCSHRCVMQVHCGIPFSAIVGDSPSMSGGCRTSRSVAAFDAAPPGAHLITRLAAMVRARRSLLASGDIPACRLLPSGGNHQPHSPLAGEPNDSAPVGRALSPRNADPRRGQAPLRHRPARLPALSLPRQGESDPAMYAEPLSPWHPTLSHPAAAQGGAVPDSCPADVADALTLPSTADPSGGVRKPQSF